MRTRIESRGRALLAALLTTACCSKSLVLYQGRQRSLGELALLTVDASSHRGEGASWKGSLVRVDGEKASICAGSGVVELLPGCHLIEGYFDVTFVGSRPADTNDWMVAKPGSLPEEPFRTTFHSGTATFEVRMKAGHLYELSAKMAESLHPEIVEVDRGRGAVGWYPPLAEGEKPTGCAPSNPAKGAPSPQAPAGSPAPPRGPS